VIVNERRMLVLASDVSLGTSGNADAEHRSPLSRRRDNG
jgi:hypothetical protein